MKITLQRTSPNYRQKLSTTAVMNYLTVGLLVIVAWSLVAAMMNNGSDYLIKALLIYAVSVGVALVTEVVWAYVRKTNIVEHIKGSFPLVTSIIFALTLPVGTPLYVVAIGSFLAIFLGKLVYGGFGHNIFNPALVGRVIVHLSYGAQLTTTLGAVDANTGATPATMLAGTSWLGGEVFNEAYSLLDLFLGNHGGTLGETCIWVILLVGVFLAWKRVFDVRIPAAYLGTVTLLAMAFALANGLNPLTYAVMHLCIGGVVFGAVIMATDPVTSPTSPLGKIIFGIGLGFLTMIIRFKANYPEGVLFSILMMNMLTPLIDSFVLGRTHKNAGKKFAVIGATLALAIGCTFGVGLGIKADVAAAEQAAKEEFEAAKKDAIAKAQQDAEAMNWELLGVNGNTYTVQVDGFKDQGHPMKVEVTIDGDTVKSVKVVEFKGETEYFGLDLIEGLKTTGAAGEFYNKFMTGEFKVSEIEGYNMFLKDDYKEEADKGDIDVYTGSTFTTKGIVYAIKGAIAVSQLDKTVNGNTITFNLKANGFNAGSPMKIKVVVDKAAQKVTKVEVLEYAGETEYFGKDMIEGIASGKMKDFYDQYLTKSFSFDEIDDVDTATGATLTTKGIVSAIRQAIAASK